jgi:sulfite reductase beta subunit-like hemoprotein
VKGVQKKAFREVVEKYGLNAIITAEQDLVLTGIDPADRPAVQATLEAAGFDTEAGAGANATNRLDKQAIACPALPLLAWPCPRPSAASRTSTPASWRCWTGWA